MALYTAFENPYRTDDRALIMLADRFNWWAFLVPPFWALGRKLWRVLVGMFLFALVLAIGQGFVDLPVGGLYLVASLWLGFEACRFRARDLERRGWQKTAELVASDLTEAEEIYLTEAGV